MKKITIALILAFAITVPSWNASAKNQNEKDKMRTQLEAKDVKIHKKKVLTEAEKKALDDLIKGKPTTPPGKNKNTQEVSATGILGEPIIGEKYAVVIGICDYPGTANDICLSDGDAQNMNDALINIYGYNPENVILLRDMNATYGNILNAVDAIRAKVTADDEVVFFFSGHGTTGVANDGDNEKIDEGLVTHNGTSLQLIWDGQLRTWFSDFATDRIVFVFDICKAGGMNDVAGNGRVVIMSSQEKENSFVYSSGENGEGLFSRFFVNLGMLQSKADGYNELNLADGNIATEESFKYSKENLTRITSTYYHTQIPTASDLFSNDLLLGYSIQ